MQILGVAAESLDLCIKYSLSLGEKACYLLNVSFAIYSLMRRPLRFAWSPKSQTQGDGDPADAAP